MHTHNPPLRRNRDFRPVPYGSLKGMPNFKHSEPFCLLKNLSDMKDEHHHHPIKWFKAFVFGGLVGGMTGYAYFLMKP
jgi:hypothetical protein